MSKLWQKRGIAHQIGPTVIGPPAPVLAGPTSFWRRKLADNHPTVTDSNNYAAKLARQARYSPSSSPVAGYYNPPFNVAANVSQFNVPLWVMPAGYPTRAIHFARSDANLVGVGTFVSGQSTVTGVTGTWANGATIVSSFLPEGTTVVSGGGTSTLVVSNPAYVSATNGAMYSVLDPSWVSGLQGACNAVPVPRMADMPAGWQAQYNGQLCANGTDQELAIYQPSTDTMWEFWKWNGDETSGYKAIYGGRITNLSTSDGTVPNTWGAKACSLLAAGGVVMAQEVYDGVIPHAINVGIPVTAPSHLSPATRNDSLSLTPSGSFADAVPEGAIFRLPANTVINPAWSPFLKMFATAVRDYGMVIVDTSGTVAIQLDDPRTADTQFGSARGAHYFTGVSANTDLVTFPWESLVQVTYP